MRRDPYVIDIERERNYYSYGRFGHFVRNCRNWSKIGQERKIEYGNNLNEEESLVVFN